MILPYTVDVPLERLPLANWLLIAATLALTIQGWLHDARPYRQLGLHATGDLEVLAKKLEELQKTRERLPPTAWALVRGQVAAWQFFTYVFAHHDFGRLVGNLVFLFCFGNAVNAKLGHGLFLILYFALGAFAGLCWLLVGHGPFLVGAAGAVMGICGVFLVFFPQNEVRVLTVGMRGYRVFEMPSMLLVVLAMLLDLLGTLVFAKEGGAAYVCHLSGEVLGVVLGLALLLTGLVESEEYELNLLQVVGLRPRPRTRGWKREG